MNDIIIELNTLFSKIQATQKILKSSEGLTLDELKRICDTSSQMVAIFSYGDFSYSMIYCNRSAFDFLGTYEEETKSHGLKYIFKLIHPENIAVVYNIIRFYADKNNNNKMFSHAYHIKSVNGWEWTYACIKPAILNKSGEAQYLLGVACSIDKLLKNTNQIRLFKDNFSFYENSVQKLLNLSEREKQVLKLIAEEHTSKQIANLLNISHLTVDTYRKNLIEKLQVKSSIGLAKYAMLLKIK